MTNAVLKTSIQDIGSIPPVRIETPEPWQWKVLGTALANDPGFRFFFGTHFTVAGLTSFMEAAVKGALESGGSVFATPDEKAVLVWRWYGAQIPECYVAKMFSTLGIEGTKRYLDFRRATDVPIDPANLERTMRPNYIGVLPEVQCRGVGSYLLKSTLGFFDRQGFDTPFLVASTRRAAKLYGPLLGFYTERELFLGNDESSPMVIMRRQVSIEANSDTRP